MKSSTYYFHIKTKILADFQICISVLLIIRYFSKSVEYNLFPFSFTFMPKPRKLFLDLKKTTTTFVFETFSKILLVLIQFVRPFRSIFKSLFNLLNDLLMIERFVASTKCFIATWRSVMSHRNRKGPKTDPCGTPQVILEILDAKPFIDTNCLRSVEYAKAAVQRCS